MKKKKTPKSIVPSVLDSENWISQSSLRAANNQGNSSGSGGPQTTLSVKFTNPAPPSKILPCGEEIQGNAKASGPDAASTFITVTGPDGSVCGDGPGECSFYYAPDSGQCGEELAFTASAVNCADATGTVTEPKVTISEIPRVPLHKDIAANLRKCTITIVPDNIELTASIERDQNSGTKGGARFAQGGNSMRIMGATEVSIAGFENSDVAANMRLIVKKGNKVYAEKSFSVRTWPKQGAFLLKTVVVGRGTLWWGFQWLSETNDVRDLSQGIKVGEVVRYDPEFPIPPYTKPLPPNPTILPMWDGNESGRGLPTIGYGLDQQKVPKGGFGKPYVADVNTAKQLMGFWDTVLDGNPTKDNIHVLQGPIDIERTISKDTAGVWNYKVKKLNVPSNPYVLP